MSKSLARMSSPLSMTPSLAYRFRRLANKYHPLKNPSDLATNTLKFNEICEAFDVLSNRKRLYNLINLM